MSNDVYQTVSFRLPLPVYEKFCRIVRAKATNKGALCQRVITDFTNLPQRASKNNRRKGEPI